MEQMLGFSFVSVYGSLYDAQRPSRSGMIIEFKPSPMVLVVGTNGRRHSL